MDENLQRLARQLRMEKCPSNVLENVKSRIAQRRKPGRPLVLRSVVVAFGMTMLMAGLVVWRWPIREVQETAPAVVSQQPDRVQVVHEAGLALGYIGAVLLEAGQHTESVLLNEAVPPLRTGFEKARKTIESRM